MQTMTVNETEYQVHSLLGHGKGGYSYLVSREGKTYVLKQIHHEPCDYYTFGNKLESEYRDYQRLLETGIRIPRLLDIDWQQERILKEYIDGPTVFQLVKDDALKPEYQKQMEQTAQAVYARGLNIDYFPTNLVVNNGLLYYIDFECNDYMEQWDFAHWGIRYWSKTPEFLEYLREHTERSSVL